MNQQPQYSLSDGSHDRAVRRWCRETDTGHVIDVPVYTAVLRLHAAFPWLGREQLARLVAHQTGRYLHICQSAVSRLAALGELEE